MWYAIIGGLIVPILLYIVGSYSMHLLECRKYPLGPFPIPIFGNLHLLGTEPHKILAAYSKKYGTVFSISLGLQRVVIISDITTTREALVQKASVFAGRPRSYLIQLVSSGYKGIAFMDYGSFWKVLRKASHSSLKIYGEGHERFEKILTKESEELHKRLLKKSKNSVELKTEFGAAIINVICFIVFGERYQYLDPEFKEVLTTINDIVDGLSNTTAVGFLPWLRFLPFSPIKKLRTSLSKYILFLNDQLKKHKKTFDENNIRHFTDSIINFSNKKAVKQKYKNVDEHLVPVIRDLFITGSETVLTSLLWLILYMMHYPEYQQEIFIEITTIIDENRYPCLNDRDSLHLVKASLKECLRLSSIVPLGLPHKTTRKTVLMGHSIPENATVMINHWQIHNDTNYWENPNKFNPYRWIGKDMKFDPSKAASFLPFSAGTRVCLGKTVAENELFFFFSRLIRDFKFECTPGCPPPSLIGNCNITHAPKQFCTYLTPRKNNLM
ncbi:cytochrome P450 2U1-like [Hydra vulgaris]|uniref:Cytochrome P450 2U1-like n=1 Tax=Hydra vulgaris TaxID=6087 RepID=A0ABM4BJY7_HYDVU